MYLHRGISRLQAEELLLTARDDGSFLVRDSESLPGAYVLCLLWQSRVHQYRILTQKDGKLSVQSEGKVQPVRYNDIDELVQGYLQRGEQNGLVGPLRKPVMPEKHDIAEIDSDDEIFEDVGDMSPDIEESSLPNGGAAGNEKCFTRSFKYSYLSSFARLDLSCCDGAFVDSLKKYIDSGLEKDATKYQKGDEGMPEFQHLIQAAGKGLQRELDVFLLKLSMCRDVLTQDETDVDHTAEHSMNGSATSYISFLTEKLANCKAQILKVEKKAHDAVTKVPDESYCYLDSQDMQDIRDQLQGQRRSFVSSIPRATMHIPLASFEVKVTKPGKLTSKMTLTVDLKQGRMYAVKPSKEFLDSSNNFSHDKILQLIKNTADNSRLDIIIEGKKKTTYSFENAHVRENFCLQIRQMKSLHSTEAEVDQISVFIGTWNMGIDPRPTGHQANTLPLGYVPPLLESCSLWGLRLVILINPVHKNMISHIQKSSVKTGIANTLGNKGATAISFQFNGTSLCFINAHLTSGEERLLRRNNNFRNILKGLSLGVKNLEGFDVTHKFHHVFFFGDLNYRLSEKIDVILKKTEEKDLPFLLEKDQLRKSQFNKTAFYAFSESEITFLPTYRLYRHQRGYNYDWKKIKKTGERINVPSWCDRILWHSYSGTFIENHAYGTANNLLNSDHRPVFASFTIGVASQFVQNRASVLENNTIKILLNRIEAEVKTCNKQNFVLEFYSSCLPNIICCEPNSKFIDSRSNCCCPVWTSANLPLLKPLFNSREFLEEQHILIAVKSSGDDDESYGECVIPLKNMFSPEFQLFDAVLTHNGEETGKIRGEIRVSMGGKYKVGKYKKTYEVVALDTEYQDPEEFLPGLPRPASKQESQFTSRSPVYENTQQAQPMTSITDPSPSLVAPPRSHHSQLNADGALQGGGQATPRPATSGGLAASDHHLNISASPPSSSSANSQASKPTAGRRPKPIMGQSVLLASQTQVMPVVSTTAATATNLSNMRSSESAPTGFSSSGAGGGGAGATGARQGQKVKDKVSNVPPPLPKKQKHPANEMNYEGLYKPSSVQEWLSGIGLDELIAVFTEHSWDDVSRLSSLTAHELMRMGIQNTEHRNRIMISLQDMY
ncbi:phosphatidylinositol 3,4,5-trisphosphate 5-phosphatase 2A-like [Gigantopelta aegis]|uniref:phosphatidylinositol 3,4,5-trisphosphate 5-phosphatase 2A-like n=1 Tax=Gigantopelta aegis TaxID=1735272 RepID=UPI001B88AF4B|nr:phosphatidylinositol 3,4,5-trisphosphate 5-phosphatase 2A-like [Gigantopelta aegis]